MCKVIFCNKWSNKIRTTQNFATQELIWSTLKTKYQFWSKNLIDGRDMQVFVTQEQIWWTGSTIKRQVLVCMNKVNFCNRKNKHDQYQKASFNVGEQSKLFK